MANVTARCGPSAAIALDAGQMYLIRAAQACYRLFTLQPGRGADTDGLRLVNVWQIAFGTTFFTVHKPFAFTHPLDNGRAFLSMALRTADGWKAPHFYVSLIEELFEQFLKL